MDSEPSGIDWVVAKRVSTYFAVSQKNLLLPYQSCSTHNIRVGMQGLLPPPGFRNVA